MGGHKKLIQEARRLLKKQHLTNDEVKVVLQYHEVYLDALLQDQRRIDFGVGANLLGTVLNNIKLNEKEEKSNVH